jgi:hypothetical protein
LCYLASADGPAGRYTKVCGPPFSFSNKLGAIFCPDFGKSDYPALRACNLTNGQDTIFFYLSFPLPRMELSNSLSNHPMFYVFSDFFHFFSFFFHFFHFYSFFLFQTLAHHCYYFIFGGPLKCALNIEMECVWLFFEKSMNFKMAHNAGGSLWKPQSRKYYKFFLQIRQVFFYIFSFCRTLTKSHFFFQDKTWRPLVSSSSVWFTIIFCCPCAWATLQTRRYRSLFFQKGSQISIFGALF